MGSNVVVGSQPSSTAYLPAASNMRVLSCFLLTLVTIISDNHADAARILGVFPTPSKSHWILGSSLLKELASDGHEVTDVSPFKLSNPPANYHHVEIATDHEFFNQKVEQLFSETDKSQISKMVEMYTAVNYFSNSTLSSPAVKQLLRSNQKFDLVILEIFLDHALLGFAEHFGCPVIGTTTHGVLGWINSLVGTPQPLSYVPHVHIGFSNPMNFWQRMANVIFTAIDETLLSVLVYPEQDRMYREAFPNAKRSLSEMRRDAVSLVLVNNHFSLSYPRPYVPNMIEIGGFHVNRKVNPLPENILNFIANSTDGVIYFSMGSNLKPSQMGKEKQQDLLNAFSKVKQNVIWKWDDESLKLDKSKYFIAKWLPQDDILAHPNVKLFITHGGLLSCTESIHHGKPIIGIPIFGDQQMNMDQAEKAGWGVAVKFTDLNEESITNALNEVLNNDKYTKTVQLISKRLRDQPLPPMDMAKYWVNYVLRHDGAEHLKSPGQQFCFIQYHNIDLKHVPVKTNYFRQGRLTPDHFLYISPCNPLIK
ncbi:AAEL010381-PA [Aedes aegypti]|uniref:UDP-glucuronosyltransferase n=1 Tax=Aedes aegypti TaxID=7159 RepID=Q16T57_AEDAE|nr:AAEL010381-PA [Aedes aegypti]